MCRLFGGAGYTDLPYFQDYDWYMRLDNDNL